MSYVFIQSSYRHNFFKNRKKEVIAAAECIYDCADENGTLGGARKCIVYEPEPLEENVLILVFPYIEESRLVNIEEKCKYFRGFQYINRTLEEADMDLLPILTLPELNLGSHITDFMLSSHDCIIGDLTLEAALHSDFVLVPSVSTQSYVPSTLLKVPSELTRVTPLLRSDSELLKGMINYLYNETIFPNVKRTKCNRLELESEIMKISMEAHTHYKSEMTQKKISLMRSEVSENDISSILFESLVSTMVFSHPSNNTIWYFKDGLWKEDASGSVLWNIISTDLLLYFQEMSLPAIVEYLQSVTARSRVFKDLRHKLYNNDFLHLLNSRRDVIGLPSANVYDIEKNIYRRCFPSDYISITTGTDLTTHVNQELHRVLDTVFPIPEVKKFFLRSCASFLEGYNKHKVFFVWWGLGNNAKSMMQRLINVTFGEYCTTAPTSLITGKRTESSGATPDMSHIESKLVVFLQEPNPEEKIKTGRIKELTGNDAIYTRDMYRAPRVMKVKCKLVIVCNNAMEIPDMDAAFRRRLVVVPFMSTFVDEDEYEEKAENIPHCYKLDPDMEDKVLGYKDVFLKMLVDEYQEFKKHGLEIPEIIRKKTREYISSNNHGLKFIQEHIRSCEGTSMLVSDVYDAFKDWFKSAYPGKRIPDVNSFSKELRNANIYAKNGVLQDVILKF
jgi:P4 family phage/plasmid primase-like protien